MKIVLSKEELTNPLRAILYALSNNKSIQIKHTASNLFYTVESINLKDEYLIINVSGKSTLIELDKVTDSQIV